MSAIYHMSEHIFGVAVDSLRCVVERVRRCRFLVPDRHGHDLKWRQLFPSGHVESIPELCLLPERINNICGE